MATSQIGTTADRAATSGDKAKTSQCSQEMTPACRKWEGGKVKDFDVNLPLPRYLAKNFIFFHVSQAIGIRRDKP